MDLSKIQRVSTASLVFRFDSHGACVCVRTKEVPSSHVSATKTDRAKATMNNPIDRIVV